MDDISNIKLRGNQTLRRPNKSEINNIATELQLRLTDEEENAILDSSEEILNAYDRVEKLAEPEKEIKYARMLGHRESTDDAWYWRCEIKGADEGLLHGKTIAIKDNICVAGIPMSNGSKLLEGFTPDVDASVVVRILDAGGTIKGKAVCEACCFSCNSWTSSTGPVRNPYDLTRTSGGSSSGSASLVARDIVDMALGSDQAGSIRTPASSCGIVGLKPTYGLVPYTGIIPMDCTLDYVGPMTKTVGDCALLLEAIAGYDDGKDPRQRQVPMVPRYSQQLACNDCSEEKIIGILREGFEGVDTEIPGTVKSLVKRSGFKSKEVSVPLHNEGVSIATPIILEGKRNVGLAGNISGRGYYCTSLQEAIIRGCNLRPHDAAITVKRTSVIGEYIYRLYHKKYYAKAQNLILALTKAYDDAFKDVDVLVMPTMPCLPQKLPTTKDSVMDAFRLTTGVQKNTVPFNLSGHPALTLNAGFHQGMPCGVTIVGKYFDEISLFQVGQKFERMRDCE